MQASFNAGQTLGAELFRSSYPILSCRGKTHELRNEIQEVLNNALPLLVSVVI